MKNTSQIEDNDKIIIVKIKVSLNKYHMVITTRNILRLLLNEDLVLFIDLTYKYSWNQWPFHILEVSDKHYYFHPIGYMFGLNEDSNSHALFAQSALDVHA